MSPSPSPSSGKLAGFILLGVAAIALVIGLVTAFGGDSQDQAGGPVSGAGNSSPGGQGSGPGQPGPSGSGQGQQPGGGNGQGGNGQNGNGQGQGGDGQGGNDANQPPSSYPRGSTTKVIPPPPADEGGNGGANGGSGGTAQGVAATKLAPVRVYNNSTIKGLAHEAANDFRAAGFKVIGVGNYPQGTIPTSTVYYRPGTGEQATATSLGKRFGMRVEQRFPGINKSSPGVIVIVTNNYSS